MRWLGRYVANLVAALSQLGSAVIGRSPQQTLSGGIGENVNGKGIGPAIAREVDSLLDKLDPGHAETTAEYEARLLREGKRRPGAFDREGL